MIGPIYIIARVLTAAVGATLVAACLLDLGEEAVVGVLVAETAAAAGRVELLKAVVCVTRVTNTPVA